MRRRGRETGGSIHGEDPPRERALAVKGGSSSDRPWTRIGAGLDARDGSRGIRCHGPECRIDTESSPWRLAPEFSRGHSCVGNDGSVPHQRCRLRVRGGGRASLPTLTFPDRFKIAAYILGCCFRVASQTLAFVEGSLHPICKAAFTGAGQPRLELNWPRQEHGRGTRRLSPRFRAGHCMSSCQVIPGPSMVCSDILPAPVSVVGT